MSNKELKKSLKKKIKRATKPENLMKIILIVATVAMLATSILPYLL